jgi:hypothetical protein
MHLALPGSNDPDDLIVSAFKAYEEEERKISAEKFRWALTKWGDKFSAAEVDDIFGEFEIDDDGFLDGKVVCGLFVAGGGEEKPVAEEKGDAKGEEGAAAPEDGGDDGGKKKKKKKKAAK